MSVHSLFGACYDYERREGNQDCPQCKTRYKRIKGYPRVEGDEDEDDIDDLENEFHIAEATLSSRLNLGRGSQVINTPSEFDQASVAADVLLLTYGQRPMDPRKDLAVYGYGSVTWRQRMEDWKKRQSEKLQVVKHEGSKDFDEFDDPELPKILHPVNDAYALWLTSVICEIWFAVSWILDQFPKWCPIERETYLDRLSLRYEKEGKPFELADIDVFVSAVDPLKEPPLITANTVLSILAVDYPVEKVACYVSDDGAAMLTFEALSET